MTNKFSTTSKILSGGGGEAKTLNPKPALKKDCEYKGEHPNL